MALPTDDARRKQIRAFQGFVKYFPDATALVAYLSKVANEQHNPGEPMHWAKEKSTEELDSLMNHLMDIASKGELSQDSDGILDAIKVAWRGMANLQRLVDKYGTDYLMDVMNGTDLKAIPDVPERDKTTDGPGLMQVNRTDRVYDHGEQGCLSCGAPCLKPLVRCDRCIDAYLDGTWQEPQPESP